MIGRIAVEVERAGRGPRAARGGATLALLALMLGGSGGSAGASAITIMPLGDSITEGFSDTSPIPGGYRSVLYRDLTAAGYDARFVGSQTTNSDPTLPASAAPHEGHIGFVIFGDGYRSPYSVDGFIGQWLAPGNGVNPNVILLQLGSNEIIGNYHVAAAPYELAALITRITELRPTAEVLVSTLTPVANVAWNAEIQTFNKSLGGPDGIVAQLQRLGEKVVLVDAGGSLSVSDVTPYGIHPTREGYIKLGNAWFNAIEANAPPGPAPEPSTLAVVGLGSLGLLAAGRARGRANPRA